jgi:EamA domain-containing membrane protein RarD
LASVVPARAALLRASCSGQDKFFPLVVLTTGWSRLNWFSFSWSVNKNHSTN